MRRLLLLVAILFILACCATTTILTPPHLYLGEMAIGLQTPAQIEKTVAQSSAQPVFLTIRDRRYQLKPQDLGLSVNRPKTMATITALVHQSLPRRLIRFLKAIAGEKTQLLPVLDFSASYYQFIDQTVFDFTLQPDIFVVDNVNKQIAYQTNAQRWKIDGDDLKTQLFFRFGSQPLTIEPLLRNADSGQKQHQIFSQNQQLKDLFSQPLHLVINDNQTLHSYTITPDQLKTLISIAYNNQQEQINLRLNEPAFQRSVLANLQSRFTADRRLDVATLRADILNAANGRLQASPDQVIVATIGNQPNTQGEKADRYIEIDLSQQNMYLFEFGRVKASYRISSGLYRPTPTGTFKIINKAPNAYSEFYHVWMPYWMAFYYEKATDSYYGIHELPYWITDNGQKQQRPREFIGSPHTGGCVSLDIGAAQTVYQFAQIDMPVYIFN